MAENTNFRKKTPAAKTTEDIPLRRTMSFKPPSFFSNTAKSLRSKLAGTRTTLSEGGDDDTTSLSYYDLMTITPEIPFDLPPPAESPPPMWGSDLSLDELTICEALEFPCPPDAKLEIARSLQETARRRRAEAQEEQLAAWEGKPQQPGLRSQRSRSLDSLNAAADESLESMAASMDTRIPSPPIMEPLSPIATPPPTASALKRRSSAVGIKLSPSGTTPLEQRPVLSPSKPDFGFPRTRSITSVPGETIHETEVLVFKDEPERTSATKKERTPRARRKGKREARKRNKKARETSSPSSEGTDSEARTSKDSAQSTPSGREHPVPQASTTPTISEVTQHKPPSPISIEPLPPAALARDDSIDQFDKDTFQEKLMSSRFTCRDHGQMSRRANLRHQCSMDETRSVFSLARDSEREAEARIYQRTQRHSEARGSDEPSQKVTAQRPCEKRRLFFLRKQTNSAPDSMEDHTAGAKAREHHSVSFCLGSRRSKGSSDASGHAAPLPPTIRKLRTGVFVHSM